MSNKFINGLDISWVEIELGTSHDWVYPVMTGTQSYRYLINISPINEQPASLLTQSDWVPQKDWVTSRTGTQSDWTGLVHTYPQGCESKLMLGNEFQIV